MTGPSDFLKLHFECLSNAANSGDSTSEAAWESLNLVISSLIDDESGTRVHNRIIPVDIILKVRRFLMNVFPLPRIRRPILVDKKTDTVAMDYNVRMMQSNKLFQLFKLFISCISRWEFIITQENEWKYICSVFNPIFQACMRRDQSFSIAKDFDCSEKGLLFDGMIQMIKEESSLQASYYKALTLLQMMVLLDSDSYDNYELKQNSVSICFVNMVHILLRKSRIMKECTMMMSILISQTVASFTRKSNLPKGYSSDDWLGLSLTVYLDFVQSDVDIGIVDKEIYNNLQSMSLSTKEIFMIALARFKRRKKPLPSWVYLKWSIMTYESYGCTGNCGKIMNKTRKNHNYTTSFSFEQYILDVWIDPKEDIDPYFNTNILLDHLIKDQSNFDCSKYKYEIQMLREMSSMLFQSINSIVNNVETAAWPMKTILIDLARELLRLKTTTNVTHANLAVVSICDTVFTHLRDIRSSILLILLDFFQNESIENDSRDFFGILLVYLCRKSAILNDDICEYITSSLINMVNGIGGTVMKPSMTKYVIRAVAFSEKGRLWIYENILSDRYCCNDERRCSAVMGLVALMELGTIPKFLSDPCTIYAVKSACDIIQTETNFLDILFDFECSDLDSFIKDRLSSSILISILHHFHGGWDPVHQNHHCIFISKAWRLENLPTLIEALIKLLPTESLASCLDDHAFESEFPHHVTIAISCIRSIISFLQNTESSTIDSGTQDQIDSPGIASYLTNIETVAWKNRGHNTQSAIASDASVDGIDVDRVTSLPQEIRLQLSNNLLEAIYHLRSNIPNGVHTHNLQFAANKLLHGTLNQADTYETMYEIYQSGRRIPSFSVFWELVKFVLQSNDIRSEDSTSNEKQYISTLVPTIRLVSSYGTQYLKFNSFSTKELSKQFIDIYFIHSHLIRGPSNVSGDCTVEDDFDSVVVKDVLLDLMSTILTYIPTTERNTAIFDLPFIGTFLRNLCKEFKLSCETCLRGMTKDLMRSYVNLISKVVTVLEEKDLDAGSLSSAGDFIVNINMSSQLLFEVLFSYQVDARNSMVLCQVSLYQLPKVVDKIKQVLLLNKNLDLTRHEEVGAAADPILLVSALRKSLLIVSATHTLGNHQDRNTSQLIAIFCVDCIGKFWMDSCDPKSKRAKSHKIRNELDDASLLQYYKDRHIWRQTLLYSVWNVIEECDATWSSSLVDAISKTSSRIISSLKICGTLLTRELGGKNEIDRVTDYDFAMIESYLTLSCFVSFLNAAPDVALHDIHNVRNLFDQQFKGDSLISSFHACLRKLVSQLQKYENHPSFTLITFFAQKVLGIYKFSLLDNLTSYLERIGVKLTKSRKGGEMKSKSKRSRTIKRSRNKLIDEWLEADRETNDDYEDLEDFLLPG